MGKCVVHPVGERAAIASLEQGAGNAAQNVAQHTADTTRHVTAADRTAWNQKPYVCGTYRGIVAPSMGTTTPNAIVLGFQPSAVLIWATNGSAALNSGNHGTFGFAIHGNPLVFQNVSILEITPTGFNVRSGHSSSDFGLNLDRYTYSYIAFR